MAEEEEEKKEDQTEDQTEETNEEPTEEPEPTEEDTLQDENDAPSSMVQLEQRVTSLEERLLSVETPAPAPAEEPAPAPTEEPPSNESDGEDEESTDDVKKILGL